MQKAHCLDSLRSPVLAAIQRALPRSLYRERRIPIRSTHGCAVYQAVETEQPYENKFSTAVGLSAAPVSSQKMAFTLDQQVIFAVRARNLELVKERIESGGDINYQDPKHGSALESAINNNDENILQFLIDNGVDVNAENSHGIVPLEVALHHSSENIICKLSWSGAKLNNRSRPHWKERLEACLKNY